MKHTTVYYFVVAIVIIALGAFFFTLYSAFSISPSEPEVTPPANLPIVVSATSTEPSRLQIPSLSIDAKVQQVGITKSGAMGIPSNFTDVAWYKYGPVPGAIGNAVIDGHLDNAVSLPGVFKHLDQLKVEDDLYVVNNSGQKLHFKVTKTETLTRDEQDTSEIFGASTSPNLILITCQGTWEQSIKQYSNRLVVFSTLVK